MKLYREEQVREALNAGFRLAMETDGGINEYRELFINALTHIELPSDEEIEEYVKSTGYYGHCTHEYHEGIEEGAKWVRDKIQGGKQ